MRRSPRAARPPPAGATSAMVAGLLCELEQGGGFPKLQWRDSDAGRHGHLRPPVPHARPRVGRMSHALPHHGLRAQVDGASSRMIKKEHPQTAAGPSTYAD